MEDENNSSNSFSMDPLARAIEIEKYEQERLNTPCHGIDLTESEMSSIPLEPAVSTNSTVHHHERYNCYEYSCATQSSEPVFEDYSNDTEMASDSQTMNQSMQAVFYGDDDTRYAEKREVQKQRSNFWKNAEKAIQKKQEDDRRRHLENTEKKTFKKDLPTDIPDFNHSGSGKPDKLSAFKGLKVELMPPSQAKTDPVDLSSPTVKFNQIRSPKVELPKAQRLSANFSGKAKSNRFEVPGVEIPAINYDHMQSFNDPISPTAKLCTVKSPKLDPLKRSEFSSRANESGNHSHSKFKLPKVELNIPDEDPSYINDAVSPTARFNTVKSPKAVFHPHIFPGQFDLNVPSEPKVQYHTTPRMESRSSESKSIGSKNPRVRLTLETQLVEPAYSEPSSPTNQFNMVKSPRFNHKPCKDGSKSNGDLSVRTRLENNLDLNFQTENLATSTEMNPGNPDSEETQLNDLATRVRQASLDIMEEGAIVHSKRERIWGKLLSRTRRSSAPAPAVFSNFNVIDTKPLPADHSPTPPE